MRYGSTVSGSGTLAHQCSCALSRRKCPRASHQRRQPL